MSDDPSLVLVLEMSSSQASPMQGSSTPKQLLFNFPKAEKSFTLLQREMWSKGEVSFEESSRSDVMLTAVCEMA